MDGTSVEDKGRELERNKLRDDTEGDRGKNGSRERERAGSTIGVRNTVLKDGHCGVGGTVDHNGPRDKGVGGTIEDRDRDRDRDKGVGKIEDKDNDGSKDKGVGRTVEDKDKEGSGTEGRGGEGGAENGKGTRRRFLPKSCSTSVVRSESRSETVSPRNNFWKNVNTLRSKCANSANSDVVGRVRRR